VQRENAGLADTSVKAPVTVGRAGRHSRADCGIVILIPCYNEALTIGDVVREFRLALPDAAVHVYDNNSTDDTARIAGEAGAIVGRVRRQGKGSVVQRMFAEVDASVYLMVDGDGTYDAASAARLIDRLVVEELDMVVGVRRTADADAYRAGHQWGNRALSRCVKALFGQGLTDVLSGYRAFSRRFVKSFPALAQGFEIETELTVHALSLRMPVGEVATPYRARPEGSSSKLRTYRDGWRILITILMLFEKERPLVFFSILAGAFSGIALILAVPLLVTYLETGLVPRIPTAILSTGLMLLASLCVVCGLVMDAVTLARREAKRLAYLAISPFQSRGSAGD
jgi:glycosyltransferase involved in cell wall biosynthesis